MATKKKSSKPAAEQQKLRPEGIQILALEVSNIMRVRIARIIPPKGAVIEIGGKNGQGKTSLLRAIDFALTGTTKVPSQPIRAGQSHGYVKVDLGDFIVTRHFSRVDPEKSDKGNTFFSKLVIEGKNREVFKSPQALLDSFMGAFTFDPLGFMRLSDQPTRQLEALRKVVTFSEDIDAIERERKEAYDSRRDKSRELDSAKARLAATETPIEGLPEKAIDTAALTQQLSDAYNHNNQVDAKLRQRAELLARAEAVAKEALGYREEAKRLLQLAQDLDGLHSPVTAAKVSGGRIQELEAQAEAVVIPEQADTAALNNQLQEAQGVNAAVLRRDMRNGLLEEVKKLQGEFDKLNQTVEERTTRRAEVIATATMPIEGLSVSDDGSEVWYKGLPFGQASTAEQIRASAAIAIASSPKLRVMRIMDGSLLDADSMAILEEMATENNYQIWIERVGGDGTSSIVMEDGEAIGEGTVPAETKKPATSEKW